MKMRVDWRMGMVWVAGLVIAGGGCAPATTKAPAAPQTRTSLEMDPCAEQLHEIAGLLLEYYVGHQALPGSLAELKGMSPGKEGLFKCPTSGVAYVYDPNGMAVPAAGNVGRMVLYDATPVHHGLRWGIAVEKPRPGQPLVTRVIAVPQSAGDKAPWK